MKIWEYAFFCQIYQNINFTSIRMTLTIARIVKRNTCTSISGLAIFGSVSVLNAITVHLFQAGLGLCLGH